jgi:hypothetical protein
MTPRGRGWTTRQAFRNDATLAVAYGVGMFPKRMSTFGVVLGALVVAGVLGLGAYLATAADFLIWLLEIALVVALVRVIWRRVATRRR